MQTAVNHYNCSEELVSTELLGRVDTYKEVWIVGFMFIFK
jgi:hypothetical protein